MNTIDEFLIGKDLEKIKSILTESPYKIRFDEKIINGKTLFLLKYSQISSDFAYEIVRQCRGIIFESDTNNIVCRPFYKFFNYGEKYASQIDWNSVRIQEKIDGSLIKMFYYEDKWRVASNGKIDANEATIETPISDKKTFFDLFSIAMKNKFSILKEMNKDRTYMFEIVSPYNQNVVKYSQIDIFHVGTRDIYNGKEFDEDIGIQKPNEYKFSKIDDIIENAKNLKEDQEGYVVVDKYWNRIKVKSPLYVSLSHIKDGVVTPKKLLMIVISGEDDEFVSYFPAFFDEVKKIRQKYENLIKKLNELKNDISKKTFNNRKEYALYVSKTFCPAFCFSYYDGKVKNAEEFIQNSNIEFIENLLKKE